MASDEHRGNPKTTRREFLRDAKVLLPSLLVGTLAASCLPQIPRTEVSRHAKAAERIWYDYAEEFGLWGRKNPFDELPSRMPDLVRKTLRGIARDYELYGFSPGELMLATRLAGRMEVNNQRAGPLSYEQGPNRLAIVRELPHYVDSKNIIPGTTLSFFGSEGYLKDPPHLFVHRGGDLYTFLSYWVRAFNWLIHQASVIRDSSNEPLLMDFSMGEIHGRDRYFRGEVAPNQSARNVTFSAITYPQIQLHRVPVYPTGHPREPAPHMHIPREIRPLGRREMYR